MSMQSTVVPIAEHRRATGSYNTYIVPSRWSRAELERRHHAYALGGIAAGQE